MKEMNTALSLVVALGAYCPRVKLSNEKALATEKAKAKRRTRPLIGRGNYGKSLIAHFDSKRKEAATEKQLKKAA
jgi:hypothetical protein